METLAVILVPLAGTVAGSAASLFMRKEIACCIEKMLLGFAVGVMLAASVWSLLIPSIEMSDGAWIPATVGFLGGIVFLLGLDTWIPHLHVYTREAEGIKRNISGRTMLCLAVTIHNFPEGMAVGAILAGVLSETADVTIAGAFVLAMGIAIQNVPEGAIISMPLRSIGMSKGKAFGCGVLSGIAEPIGAVLTIIVAGQMIPLLPYFLAFAAGAMIYVVIDELIPESRSDDCFNLGTVGAALGFSLMMVLDVSLG